jgi:non-ribosomal peptide synthetase component F
MIRYLSLGLSLLLINRIVDSMLLTPTLLAKMDPSTHSNIKLIVSGGESLSPTLAAKWINQGTSIVNGYGPTEITMV